MSCPPDFAICCFHFGPRFEALFGVPSGITVKTHGQMGPQFGDTFCSALGLKDWPPQGLPFRTPFWPTLPKVCPGPAPNASQKGVPFGICSGGCDMRQMCEGFQKSLVKRPRPGSKKRPLLPEGLANMAGNLGARRGSQKGSHLGDVSDNDRKPLLRGV